MLVDPATQATFVLALVPRRARGPVLRAVLGRPLGLALLALPAAVGALTWGSAPGYFTTAILANAAAFGLFATAFGRLRAPAARGLALVAIASLWTYEMAWIFPHAAISHGDTVPFWFADFFNRLFQAFVTPGLEAAGLPEAEPVILAYLSPALAFLARHLLVVHWLVSALFALGLFHVAQPHVPGLRPAPRLLTWRLGWPLLASGAGAMALTLAGVQLGGLSVAVWKLVGGVMVLRALLLGAALTSARPALRAACFGLAALALLHPALVWAFVALTATDTALDLTRLTPAGTPGRRRADAAGPRAVATFAESLPVIVLVSFLAPILFFRQTVPHANAHRPSPKELSRRSHAKAPPEPAPAEATAQVSVPASDLGPAFGIDPYEHPNRPGEQPTTGLTPAEADAACRAEGKRLCTSAEWWQACSANGERLYLLDSVVLPDSPVQMNVAADLVAACNLAFRAGTSAVGIGRLAPAGSYPACVGEYGTFDQVGNAFEWVRLDDRRGRDGWWGLAGSDFGFADDLTTSCGFRVTVHERQLPDLDLSSVGFRCCR